MSIRDSDTYILSLLTFLLQVLEMVNTIHFCVPVLLVPACSFSVFLLETIMNSIPSVGGPLGFYLLQESRLLFS
jgi:hypothetical protein